MQWVLVEHDGFRLVLEALENGTGTQTVDQYSEAQLGRLAQLATLLAAALAALL